jgi:hypothetical protein
MLLEQLTDNAKCIAIIGMEKNAGKTTVLNYLLSCNFNKLCAITSIGYDGEDSDRVTHTHKPSIYVKAGTLLATATSLLPFCDITRELLQFTGIHTSMGEVIILQARSAGFVRIAGPSITSQMEKVCQSFRHLGAEKILVDGAAARKSTSALSTADACILATGASLAPNVNQIVEQTLFKAQLLSLPALPGEMATQIKRCYEPEPLMAKDSDSGFNDCFLLKESGELINLGSSLADEAPLKAATQDDAGAIIFKGAMTRQFARRFLEKSRSLRHLRLVAHDGSKFLFTRQQFQDFLRRSAAFYLYKPARLIALTINPFAPDGAMVDSVLLKCKLEEAIGLPVFDLMGPQNRRAVA